MSKAWRVVIKILFYAGGFILVGVATSGSSKMGMYLFCFYLIIGAAISTILRLPLYSKLTIYHVGKEHYDKSDTVMNLIFALVALGLLLTAVLKQGIVH